MTGGGFANVKGTGPRQNKALDSLTGELGEQLVDGLEQRLRKGEYGDILKAASDWFGARVDGRPPVDTGRLPGDPLDTGSGTGGAAMGAGLSAPGGLGGPGGPGGGGAGGVEAIEADPEAVFAGITFLGKGAASELLEEAQKRGIDVLVVFEVQLKDNVRPQLVTNDTRLVVYDVRGGIKATLVRTPELNNIQIQRFRDEDDEDSKEEDPVDAAFARFWEMLDEDPSAGLMLTEIPEQLQSENVLGRIRSLLDSPPENPLPVLSEIKFYQRRGLLSDEHLKMAYQRLIGELPGGKLAEGTLEERTEVLDRWLPKTGDGS